MHFVEFMFRFIRISRLLCPPLRREGGNALLLSVCWPSRT